MSDKLHRFLLEKLNVRGGWIQLDNTWQDILATADYPKPIREVLGEAITAVSLIASSLKFKGSLIMQMNDTYPVTMLVVQASSEGTLRGIARWTGQIEDDTPFRDLFGDGRLVMSIQKETSPPPDTGKNQSHIPSQINKKGKTERTELYQSIISLDGDNLSEVLAAYFKQSEQLDTQFILTADENKAAGLMLQSLPTTDDDKGWDHALALANTIKSEEILALEAQEILHLLYHEEDLRLYDGEERRFQCTCSQEKVESLVKSLGKEKANETINEQGNISIDCQFCNQRYQLDPIDIKRIFSGFSSGSERMH